VARDKQELRVKLPSRAEIIVKSACCGCRLMLLNLSIEDTKKIKAV